MGNRANIVVKQYPDTLGEIFLYSHWDGEELVDVLHAALSRRARWDDTAYLTRIIFCHMVAGDVLGATGYGISVERPDNSHDYIVVDVANQEVRRETEKNRTVTARMTFEEFVANPALLRRNE